MGPDLYGRRRKAFTAVASTFGASQGLAYEGTRRRLVNGVFWAARLEEKIPARTNVEMVANYEPTPFRFKKSEEWRPGIRPAGLLR